MSTTQSTRVKLYGYAGQCAPSRANRQCSQSQAFRHRSMNVQDNFRLGQMKYMLSRYSDRSRPTRVCLVNHCHVNKSHNQEQCNGTNNDRANRFSLHSSALSSDSLEHKIDTSGGLLSCSNK